MKRSISLVVPVVCLFAASTGRCDLVTYTFQATVNVGGATPTAPVTGGDVLSGFVTYNVNPGAPNTLQPPEELKLWGTHGGSTSVLFDGHSVSASAAQNFNGIGSYATVGFGSSAKNAALHIELQSFYDAWALPALGLPDYPIPLSLMAIKSLQLVQGGVDGGATWEVDATLTSFDFGGPNVHAAPEPASLSLMAMGALALAGFGGRRRVARK